MAKKSKLENSIDELLQLVQTTNDKIKELGVCDEFLYKTLNFFCMNILYNTTVQK
jgi:hypothetical protein